MNIFINKKLIKSKNEFHTKLINYTIAFLLLIPCTIHTSSVRY